MRSFNSLIYLFWKKKRKSNGNNVDAMKARTRICIGYLPYDAKYVFYFSIYPEDKNYL